MLFQFSFNDHLSYPVCHRGNAQGSHFTIGFWYQLLSYCRGKVASAGKPVPYRVKVFPWLTVHCLNGYTINTGTLSFCSHQFESFPDFRLFNRIPLLFLFKNHPQFSLSCYTKRNLFCEALRSCPVSGTVVTTTASSAPERIFGISGLLIQVFAIFPYHFLSGSPVP